MSDKKKSKRRSSFSANRVSLLARDVSSANDLHHMVEDELQKGQRLAKLSRLCLQHSFAMLEKEFQDSEWFKSFRDTADGSTNDLISRLEDEDMFTEACEVSTKLPNPVNIAMAVKIADAEAKTIELGNENQKWNTILEVLHQKRKESEEACENLEVTEESLSDEVKTIARSQYLKPRHDYGNLITSTRNGLNRAALQMEIFCNKVGLLDRATKGADDVEARLTQQLYEETFKGIKDSKDAISGLISLPSPSKTESSL